jgi:hypothetical protein
MVLRPSTVSPKWLEGGWLETGDGREGWGEKGDRGREEGGERRKMGG